MNKISLWVNHSSTTYLFENVKKVDIWRHNTQESLCPKKKASRDLQRDIWSLWLDTNPYIHRL